MVHDQKPSLPNKGNDWIITGRKTFTTLSPILDIILVTAWVPEEEVMGTFLIHRNLEGVSIEETWDMVSMQGTGSHDLVLQNVKVPDQYFVVRQPGKNKVKVGYCIFQLVI